MVTNVRSGVTRQSVTTSDGVFRVLSLGPGVYRVEVVKLGFLNALRESVSVGISETVRLDFTLEVSGVQESVTVTTNAPLVETEQGRVSGQVDRMQLQEMPLSGRNLYNLIALQPGVTGKGVSASISGGGGADDSFAGESAPRINASGQRDEANNYTVDQTSTNGVARGGITNLTPNTESVEEVRVVSNNFSAVDGRSPGAQVQVITKSGTNEFRGSGSVLLPGRPAVGQERVREFGAQVRQEPVWLQPGRSDRQERALLLHVVRGPAADRRARLVVHRRNAAVPQLHPVDASEQHRGAAAAQLRAGGRSDDRFPRSRQPGAWREHDRPSRWHPRRRERVLRPGRLASWQPVQRPRRLRTAAGEGSPLRQLLPDQFVRRHRWYPSPVQSPNAEHDALRQRQLHQDIQQLDGERVPWRRDAARRPAGHAATPRNPRHHDYWRHRLRPVRLPEWLVADELGLQEHPDDRQVQPPAEGRRRVTADVRLGHEHEQLHSRRTRSRASSTSPTTRRCR